MSETGNNLDMPEDRVAVVKEVHRVFDGFLKIDEATVSHPRFDGGRQTVKRQSMERGDSVAVMLVDRVEARIWLTEQFRYPTLSKGPGWIEELPAGMQSGDESFEETARREIAEETGLTIKDLEHATTFYVSPGGTSERIVLFYANVDGQTSDEGLARERRDAEEDIRLIETDIEEFMIAAQRGNIDDAKTLIAGLWLMANRERLSI